VTEFERGEGTPLHLRPARWSDTGIRARAREGQGGGLIVRKWLVTGLTLGR
jgi:hypothetical protein